MARNVEFGIIVTAKDAASETARTIGKAWRGLDKDVQALAKRGREAFKFIKEGAAFMNDAMQIAQRVFSPMLRGLESVISKSLEFRFSNDAAKVAITNFGKEVDTLVARIGDLFIPSLAGIARGMTDVAKGTQKWTAENEKLLTSDISQFVIDIGQNLVVVLAAGAEIAVDAINGLTVAWHETRAAALKFGSFMTILGGLMSPNKAVYDQQMEMAREMLRQARESERQSDATSKAWDKEVKAIEKWQQTISDAMERGRRFANEYSTGMKRASSATKELEDAELRRQEANANRIKEKIDRQVADQKRLESAITEGIAAAGREYAEKYTRLAELSEKTGQRDTEIQEQADREAKDRLDKLADKKREMVESAAGEVEAMTRPFQAVALGAMSAEAAVDQFISNMEARILEFLVSETLKSLFSLFANISTGGLFGFIGKIFGFARGGEPAGPPIGHAARGLEITGGRPSQDSVLVATQQGERILTPEENRHWKMGGRSAPAPSSGRPIAIISPSRLQLRRIMRDVVGPEQRLLARYGYRSG